MINKDLPQVIVIDDNPDDLIYMQEILEQQHIPVKGFSELFAAEHYIKSLMDSKNPKRPLCVLFDQRIVIPDQESSPAGWALSADLGLEIQNGNIHPFWMIAVSTSIEDFSEFLTHMNYAHLWSKPLSQNHVKEIKALLKTNPPVSHAKGQSMLIHSLGKQIYTQGVQIYNMYSLIPTTKREYTPSPIAFNTPVTKWSEKTIKGLLKAIKKEIHAQKNPQKSCDFWGFHSIDDARARLELCINHLSYPENTILRMILGGERQIDIAKKIGYTSRSIRGRMTSSILPHLMDCFNGNFSAFE